MHQVVEQLHGRAGRAARRAAPGGLQVHQAVEQLQVHQAVAFRNLTYLSLVVSDRTEPPPVVVEQLVEQLQVHQVVELLVELA